MIPSIVFSTVLLTSVVWAQIPDQFTSGFNNNTISLVVAYGANRVTDGEKLGLNAVQSPPTLALGDSSSLNINSQYIVVMIDPDAPSRANPRAGNFLHWVKTDLRIRSSTATNITADNATDVFPYLPPAPAEGSGEHRYVFLLYDQPRRDGFALRGLPGSTLPASRVGFNVSAWREVNGLAPAKAGTYFLAESQGWFSSVVLRKGGRANFWIGNSTSATTTRGGPSATRSPGSGGGSTGNRTGASETGASGNGSGSSAPNGAGRVAASGYGTVMACWVLAVVLGGFFMGM